MNYHWNPLVTVAHDQAQVGRFLLVKEQAVKGLHLKQSTGLLGQNEPFFQAPERETLEETAHQFTSTYLIGVYLSRFIPGQMSALANVGANLIPEQGKL